MKRLLLATVCLLPLMARAQGVPDIGISGGSIQIGKMQTGFGGKQDVGGDISGQHFRTSGAVTMPTLSEGMARRGFTPDDYIQAGDAGDDAPSIRRAISLVCSGVASTRTITFKPRHYAINSQVVVPCPVNFLGQSFAEQCGASYVCAGTWFDIGSSFINVGSGAGPFLVNGNAFGATFRDFAVDEPGMGLPPVANYDPNYPASMGAAARILSYTPSAWTPAAYWFVFEMQGTPGVKFDNVMLNGVNAGFYMNYSGRTNFTNIRGQVFGSMFNIHESYDVSRITDVHMWPYWSSADPVMLYQQNHADVIVSYRNDTALWTNIFGIQVNSVIRIGADADGTTTGFQADKIQCDSAVSCVLFEQQNVAQPFGAITTMRTFDNVWSTIYGHAPIVHNPGSTMVKGGGGAILQIGSAENYGTDISTFDLMDPNHPSNMTIGSLVVHENQMSPNSYLVRFNTSGQASLLTGSMPPLLAGSIPGWQLTNTAPSTGGGIGTYAYPTPVAVH